MKYKSCRIIDGKSKFVVVDENSKIINKSPNKEELKHLGYEQCITKYTDEELLEYLRLFDKENGGTPESRDFDSNIDYPSSRTYKKRFGGWNKALKMAGLKTNICTDTTDEELLDLLVRFSKENGRAPTWEDFNKKGVIETRQQKARLSELCVLNHFTIEGSIDLSGNNCNSHFDGICPKGDTYDVKSSALFTDYWTFNIGNIYREDIEWLYLCAYDEYYKNLLYVWRVPGNFIDGNVLHIGLNNNREHNTKNMKEYDITEKFKDKDNDRNQ